MEEFKLDESLPEEQQQEENGIITLGDEIADSFYNGKFTYGVEQMRKYNHRAKDFLEYLENKCEEIGFDSVTDQSFYNGHFSCDFWIALGSEIY